VLTVAVLGTVAARRDGVPVTVPAGLTTELLVRLALDAGHPVRAERLLDDLWPDEPDVRPNTLQAKVSQLRRALGDPALLTGGAAGYTLVADPDAVDAVDALRLAEAGAAQLVVDPAAAARTCAAGLALFGTEILPAAGTAAWVLPHRARLTEAWLRLTEDGLAARIALGAAGEVTGELEELVGRHPLRERLWALLITALYRAGRQSDALAAYSRVTRILAAELGADPGPELRELHAHVLRHDHGLDPVAVARGNVPAPGGPLVGRTAELAELRAAIAGQSLVTLVGPAGVGKTRLAIQVARSARATGGTWLVRLDAVQPPADVSAAVGGVLPGFDGPASMRGSDVLLVLDNCEHVVEDVAAFVTALRDVAPSVHVLATSRRPLGLDGESVRPLAPLPEADAVALFARRAGERGATSLDPAEPAVAQLCRALDGLPLAIELAAARARVLSVPEILERLDDRFALLADDSTARPARMRSLAAALAWSYDLLFPDDQRGLWALAQFPAGATLGALEHVLPALGVPAAATLDIVTRLVDRSLADVDPGTAGTRYRLLDSVRAYATDRATEAGVATTAADAVLGWVAALARTVYGGVRGPGQAQLVGRVAAERATVDAVLERAHDRDPAAGLRIAADLAWAWVLLDDAAAAARLRAARTAPGAGDGEALVRALLAEAWLEAMSGDLGRARTALDAATETGGGDTALTDRHAGFVLLQESRPDEALHVLHRGRAAADDTWEEGACVLLSAFVHIALGDIAAGRAACEEAIGILTPIGDAWGLLHAEAALGRVAHAEGRFGDATRHHRHAAESAERLGFAGSAAHHRTQLGAAQLQAGDPAAVATLQEALRDVDRAGDLRQLAMTRVALAQALLATGAHDRARAQVDAARRWYAASGAGDGSRLADCLHAAIRYGDGDPAAGQELAEILATARATGDHPVVTAAESALATGPGKS
jgi:predicted ATPase/DNA-binding SARP family transcriptional activator